MTSYDDTKVQLTINRMTGECYENVPDKSSTELYLISQDPTSIAKIDLDAQSRTDAEISSIQSDLNGLQSDLNGLSTEVSTLSEWTTTQISSLQQDLNGLSSEMSVLSGWTTTQIDDLQQDLNALSSEASDISSEVSTLSEWTTTQIDDLIGDVQEVSSQATQNAQDIADISANLTHSTVRRWEYVEDDTVLTFTAHQPNSTVAMQKVGSAPEVSLEYTTDGGYTWNDFLVSSSEEEGTTVTLTNIGDQVGLRAKTPNAQMATADGNRNTFSITGSVVASGNLASLFNKDVEQGKVLDSTLTWHFGGLFRGCSGLVGSAKNLKMPFVQMYGNSCETMFRESGITVAPDLPCMNVGIGSYSNMFYGCSSLTTAPELPATTIANYSYYHMFENCTSLTTPPSVLPATAPYKECYRSMFIGCTSLPRTPDIKMENTWSSTQNVMQDMFKNCTSLETATVNYMTQNNGANGMAYMFYNCTSLKNVGVKRLRGVGTKITSGLTQMLYGCSALEVVDFSEATAVPTLHSVNTFQNTNSTFQIVVPDALYDQWIVARNWSRFASQIVKASEYISN